MLNSVSSKTGLWDNTSLWPPPGLRASDRNHLAATVCWIIQPTNPYLSILEIRMRFRMMSKALHVSRQTTSVALPLFIHAVTRRRAPDWSGMICPSWSHAGCLTPPRPSHVCLNIASKRIFPFSSQTQRWDSMDCSSLDLPLSFLKNGVMFPSFQSPGTWPDSPAFCNLMNTLATSSASSFKTLGCMLSAPRRCSFSGGSLKSDTHL